MIKVEVQSAEVISKSGTSAKTGKPYSIREQAAYAYLYDRNGNAEPHPRPIRIGLDDGQNPYSPGNYLLTPESIFVGGFGELKFGRVKLRPLANAAQKVA